MKKILMCLMLLAFISMSHVASAEESQQIINDTNSSIDFSSLPNLSEYPFIIKEGSFELMNSGETQLLLSDKKWTDVQMADYKQRYNTLPLVLTIAAFSNIKEASPEQQADVFSGKTKDKILYLYMTDFTSDPVREAIALHFTETVQTWFVENDLMAIPEVIQQQNLVELGLVEPEFEGGYK